MISPAEIPGQVEQLVNLAKSVKARVDAVKANPGSADALLESYEHMLEQLRSLTKLDRVKLQRFSPHHRENLEAELERLGNCLSQAVEKLESKVVKLESMRYASTHAMRTELKLSELEGEAARARESIRHINDTLAIAERIDSIQASIEGRGMDVFRPCFTAPKNPEGIALNFGSQTSDKRPLTCEGQLKATLLRDETSNSVGTIAVGMGGVGKTCALRALAADPDVTARFPGGVYFMSLGADAGTGRVIQELCNSIAAAGGEILAAELRRERSLSYVIRKARDWFSEHVCLFVFDDLWRSKDIGADILVELSLLICASGDPNASRSSAASGVLYSTRDMRLSLQGPAVVFEARDPRGEVATNILLKSARADPAEVGDVVCREAISGVLERCQGLPVTLNICGTTVRQMRWNWFGDKRDAWNTFWSNLNTKDLIAKPSDNYGTLGVAVLLALDFLDNHSAEAESVPRSFSFREMHRALCVLSKRDWVPVEVLRWLWNLREKAYAEAVVTTMVGVGAAQVEYREAATGTKMLGVRLHDLVHDFAHHEAEKREEVSRWHAALLDGCSYALNVEECTMPWPLVVDKAEDGGYMLKNVCRLLQSAGRLGELERLLHSAGWAVKILEMNVILQFEHDVNLFLGSLASKVVITPAETGSKREEDVRESLKRWGKLVRLCLPYCCGQERVAWFQLFARLVATRNRSRWMDDVLQEIERDAPRPWLEVTGPYLKGADDELVDTFVWDKLVFRVEIVNGTEVMSLGRCQSEPEAAYVGKHMLNGETKTTKIVLEASSGSVRDEKDRPPKSAKRTRVPSRLMNLKAIPCLSCTEAGGSEKDDFERVRVTLHRRATVTCGAIRTDGLRVVTGWSSGALQVSDAATGQTLWCVVAGATGHVRDVAVTQDGRLIVSGSDDGAVRVWAIKNGDQIGVPLTGHTNRVTCVSVSGDGERAVSGSWDKTVRVWDVKSGEQVGPPLIGHRRAVVSVAVSKDGERVVSGSEDLTVRVWNLKSRDQVGQLFAGHTDVVWGVAVSWDGERVVSGSQDRTVRLWGVRSGEHSAETLTGHADWVECVAVSSDGKRVVSGSWDGTVRVWESKSKEEVSQSPPGHTEAVLSVAMSADGRRVVSGSDDNTVRVWDVTSGEQIGPPFVGHLAGVWEVAVSCDGDRILSGSLDETVRVWDVESGACIRIVEDKNWARRWDALCDEHLGAGAIHSKPSAEKAKAAFGGNNSISLGNGSDRILLATFEEVIMDLQVSARHGLVVCGLANGQVVIARIGELAGDHRLFLSKGPR